MRCAVLVFPFLLVACSPFGRRGGGIGPTDLVVCVRNELVGYGNVNARAAEARFDVMPASVSCRQVIGGRPGLILTARTIGGGAAGPLEFSEPLPSSGRGCWLWRLGPGQSDVVMPMECGEVPGVTGSNAPAGRAEMVPALHCPSSRC